MGDYNDSSFWGKLFLNVYENNMDKNDPGKKIPLKIDQSNVKYQFDEEDVRYYLKSCGVDFSVNLTEGDIKHIEIFKLRKPIKKIGFDIDDTLTITEDYVFEQFKIFCEDILKEPFHGVYNKSKYGLEGKFPKYDSRTIARFNSWYFPRMVKNAPFREGIPELFNKLKELGYEVVIVTRRDDDYEGEFNGKLMKAYTLDRFKSNFIEPDKFYFKSFNKRKTMEENKVDILVEDSINNIAPVSGQFPCIIMTNPWNSYFKEDNIRTYRITDFDINNFLNILKEV